jgi:hypothetical protein
MGIGPIALSAVDWSIQRCATSAVPAVVSAWRARAPAIERAALNAERAKLVDEAARLAERAKAVGEERARLHLARVSFEERATEA